MQQYLLSLLIFIPLIAALIALFIPSPRQRYFRLLSLTANVAQVAVLIPLMVSYDSSLSLQFVEQKPWISLDLGTWGILKAEYFVAIDGLNILFVCLTIAIMLLTTVSSWTISARMPRSALSGIGRPAHKYAKGKKLVE